MSDLSNDALAWIAERPGVASDDRITEIATELLALRAHAVAGTDGPDQGDPAAWGVISPGDDVVTVPHPIDGSNVTGSREWAQACVDRNGGIVVPLHRAPGAVAAAPPGDEEGWLSDEDLSTAASVGKGEYVLWEDFAAVDWAAVRAALIDEVQRRRARERSDEYVTVRRSVVEGAEHSLNGVGMTRVAGLLREVLDGAPGAAVSHEETKR